MKNSWIRKSDALCLAAVWRHAFFNQFPDISLKRLGFSEKSRAAKESFKRWNFDMRQNFVGFRRISPDFLGSRKFDFWSKSQNFVEIYSPITIHDEDLAVLIWFDRVWASEL